MAGNRRSAETKEEHWLSLVRLPAGATGVPRLPKSPPMAVAMFKPVVRTGVATVEF